MAAAWFVSEPVEEPMKKKEKSLYFCSELLILSSLNNLTIHKDIASLFCYTLGVLDAVEVERKKKETNMLERTAF